MIFRGEKIFYRSFVILIAVFFISCKKNRNDSLYTVYNKGISGNTVVDLLARFNADVRSLSPDLLIVMIGTNDSYRSTIGDYKTNLDSLLKQSNRAGLNVLLLSPPPIGDGVNLYKERDSVLTLMAAYDKELSLKYNCGFIDINKAFKESGSPSVYSNSFVRNSANSSELAPDGIHLTQDGNFFIAEKVLEYLTNPLVLKKGIVVCYGDSLTYGAFANGEGTATGFTYPGFLQQFLDKI